MGVRPAQTLAIHQLEARKCVGGKQSASWVPGARTPGPRPHCRLGQLLRCCRTSLCSPPKRGKNTAPTSRAEQCVGPGDQDREWGQPAGFEKSDGPCWGDTHGLLQAGSRGLLPSHLHPSEKVSLQAKPRPVRGPAWTNCPALTASSPCCPSANSTEDQLEITRENTSLPWKGPFQDPVTDFISTVALFFFLIFFKGQ